MIMLTKRFLGNKVVDSWTSHVRNNAGSGRSTNWVKSEPLEKGNSLAESSGSDLLVMKPGARCALDTVYPGHHL